MLLFRMPVRKSQKNKVLQQTSLTKRHYLPVQDALYGIRAEVVAAICQVDVATARRWKSGTSRIPHAAAALVAGDLGAFSKFWDGWKVQGDKLISPDKWTISRNDALAVPLLLGQIKALEQVIAKYKEVESLDEQPRPDEAIPNIIG